MSQDIMTVRREREAADVHHDHHLLARAGTRRWRDLPTVPQAGSLHCPDRSRRACGEGERGFHDADHGGSLGAAYAAWRWARGIA